MGCACKEKAKRLERIFPELKETKKTHRGIGRSLLILKESLRAIATRLIITICVLIAGPIMLLIIMLRFLFFNKSYYDIPLNKLIKSKRNGEKSKNKN